MINFLTTKIGRLRLLAYAEGSTLLVLVFIAVPLKHFYANPAMVKLMGPIHGAVFLVFLLNVISTSVELGWKFRTVTWKILVACFVPFGTFYLDRKLFRAL